MRIVPQHSYFALLFELLAIVVALGTSPARCYGQATTRPNIVVVMTDDASYSDYGFSAALNNRTTQFETPNLDALAQQSIVLTQGYVASPLCGTSRAGLLTGQYQQRFGYEENLGSSPGQAVSSGTFGLQAGQITIAERLKDQGYTTGMVGKWHSGYADGFNRPLDKGFDEFFGLLGGGRGYWQDGTAEHGIYRNNQFYETQYRSEGDPSLYDPVNGRYLTDAFGEEAVDFINRHAGDENPFFLYLAITAPHDPYQAKQSDLSDFAHITDPTRRTMAAMVQAMDRSVGKVVDAISSNDIDDNTMIIFLNDNGGLSYFGNGPYKGHKGTMMEGGIRVPFMVKVPGLQPGTYNGPVTAYDILPTAVAAAGGDPSQFPTDGHNILPLLAGETTEDPHEIMFWREFDAWAVRKGDWKLTSAYRGTNHEFLFNIANDPFETQYLSNPAKRNELLRELTFWEATLEKPKWGILSANNQNAFDHFVFRNDQAPLVEWNAANAWRQSDTTNNATLKPTDAYANAILEFQTLDSGNFTASNNMKRVSEFTFMLNQMRFTGNFNGSADRTGTVNGNAVLFANSLAGQAPQIQLNATSSTDDASFRFDIDLEIQLLGNLEIAGNGTQDFYINGQIRDFYISYDPTVTDPHNVTKTGSSHVTLTNNNTFRGTLSVLGGKMTLDGPSAAIDGAANLVIGDGAVFELASGVVRVPSIVNMSGGTLDFHGGTLKSNFVLGDLTNNGGTFAPGASPAATSINGGYTQNSGTLEIEIGGDVAGTQYDRLTVSESAELGGTLDVNLISGFSPLFGQTFQILSAAGGIVGDFANLSLPSLAGGLQWRTQLSSNTFSLLVGLAGDFNSDGQVDAADYTLWRDSFGQSVAAGSGADANFDGQISHADYDIWKSRFGTVATTGNGALAGTVPEPSTLVLLALMIPAMETLFQRRARR